MISHLKIVNPQPQETNDAFTWLSETVLHTLGLWMIRLSYIEDNKYAIESEDSDWVILHFAILGNKE